MDTLHTVLRSIRGETKARRDHLDVFREFLDHLDRARGARQPRARPARRKAGPRTTGAGQEQARQALSTPSLLSSSQAGIQTLQPLSAMVRGAATSTRLTMGPPHPSDARAPSPQGGGRDGCDRKAISCSHLRRTHRRLRVRARTTIEPDGTVEGYASLFGEIDQARDMVMRGAFADDACLSRRPPHPDAVPARPGRTGRRLAGAARGSARAVTRAAG